MIYHYMKDGSRRDSIDGYIVNYEQHKNLYSRLAKIRERSLDGHGTKSETFK